jgi:UDP-N-acetylmuramoyl-L-alanyl-D-glutamate--2,6-diaminopimelate ligase
MSAERDSISRDLSWLLEGRLSLAPGEDRPILTLCLDSRTAAPGSLFCALGGTRTHGLEFAPRAVAQGAVAVLAESDPRWDATRLSRLRGQLGVPILEIPALGAQLSALAGRFFGNPAQGMDVIGITGTNGKTSICQFIAQALSQDRSCGVVGTLGYGFPGRLAETGYTTPDAVRLQAVLADLKARGAGAVAMEISSHALEQGRAAGIQVDTGVFTNLTRDHLDYHGTMLDYGKAKQRLFQSPDLRHAVLNADDPFGLEIYAGLDATVQPLLYGLTPAAHPLRAETRWLRAQGLESLPRGLRARVSGSWGEGELTAGLLGRFNLSNLLAVLGVLLLRDWGLERALAQLASLRGVPGRMECFGAPGQPLVVVDYAHTPDALEQALGVLRAHRPRRLICLLGCGGDRDRGKRPLMGAAAERLSDLVLLTDDNPRREDGERIVQDILAGMQEPRRALVERNRALVIRQAVALAEAEDILLVAGKGHETTQTTGDLVVPFSDREQVALALQERGGQP